MNTNTHINAKKIWSVIGIIITAVVIVGLVNACGVSKSHKNTGDNSSGDNPIKIGVVLSLTGGAAPWGEYGKNGIDLAVKKINEAGGVNGRKVEVIVEDDHTDPKQAVSGFNKLVSIDHVDGVIGGVFDFTAQPLLPLAVNAGVPFISPSNFRIAGGFDLNPQSFVMLTNFSTTIEKLTPYIAASHIQKLAVVHLKSTFGGEIAKTLNGVMNGIVDESYNQIGNNDFKTIILKLKSQGVDAVFLDMVANDPLIFLRQAKQLNFHPTIMTYNGALDAFADESDKSLLNNVVILNWEVTTVEFSDMYTKAYGVPATKSADKFFDAVYVMAQGVAHTPETSSPSTSIADYISQTTFTTPNGSVSFDAHHAVRDTRTEIDVMKGGVLTKWE